MKRGGGPPIEITLDLLILEVIQGYTHVSWHIRASVVVHVIFRQQIDVVKCRTIKPLMKISLHEADVFHHTAIKCRIVGLRQERQLPQITDDDFPLSDEELNTLPGSGYQL